MTNNKTSNDKEKPEKEVKQRKPKAVTEPKLLPSGAKNQQRCNFARAFAEHGDKARARREAHYKESANEYVLACRLADEPDVKNAIEYWREKMRAKLDLRTEAVLGEIHSIAFSNTADVWDWDDDKKLLIVKDITKLPRRITAAIQEISTVQRTYYDVHLEQEVTETAYKVKMHNKWSALKHIADLIPKLKPHTTEGARGGTELNRKVVQIQLLHGGKVIEGNTEDEED